MVGHYGLALEHLVLFSFGIVITVFIVCYLIDLLRIATIEKMFFKWYDKKISVKTERFVNRFISERNG